MGFPKGTKLGKHKRNERGELLNRDGSLYRVVPNQGQFRKGKRASPMTEFKKGQTPFNKEKHWDEWLPKGSQEKVLSTTFKKGQLPHTAKPEGTVVRTERLRKNGYKEVNWTINIDWHGNRKPHNSYKWYLWEIENQQDRPNGMVLWLKNGNVDDMRIENFELIGRAELLRRNS